MVQPLTLEGTAEGAVLLALDGGGESGLGGVGAGVGDRVLVVQEGWSAATAVDRPGAPIDASVVGVVDDVHVA